MFHHVFSFLKNRLLEYGGSYTPEEAGVNFIDLSSDPPTFKARVNLLLINIEEENHVRTADPYVKFNEKGQKVKVKPPLQLALDVLFAVKPQGGASGSSDYNYLNALEQLSRVVEYFQANPVFSRKSYPDLPSGLDRLVAEHHTLSYSQQNEIWSALKTAYLPSVCFRFKLLTFQSEPAGADIEVTEMTRITRNT